mgnify:FL=1
MTPIRNIKRGLRLIHIALILLKYGLDEIVFATHLLRPVRFIAIFSPWFLKNRYGKNRNSEIPLGKRIRLALEELGPVFVKFGQTLSTRPDLLPEEIARELALLQDQVPPFAGEKAQEIVERCLKKPVSELFDSFTIEPLASASVAQVHSATMPDGENVVVKIIRPGIQKIIQRDIDLLYAIASLAEKYWVHGKRLRPVAVVSEFEKYIFDELDLQREAANASELHRRFQGSDSLYIPKINWSYTRKNVLVMEKISGIPVSHIEELKKHNTNLELLAKRGVEIFFTQVFRDNFFHADMHPGNIFVDIINPQDPKYIAIDFGIVGSLSPSDKRYLAENFVAFFNRDYQRVAQLHIKSGWVPPQTRVDEFEGAIRSVCEPIIGKPLAEISFGLLLLNLFTAARRFDMEVQPQLVLLQKTLLNIEGLGRSLYPELDLWQTAKPFMDKWMQEQLGLPHLISSIKENLPYWIEMLPELPNQIGEALMTAAHNNEILERQTAEINQLKQQTKIETRRIKQVISGAILTIPAAILVSQSEYTTIGWMVGIAGVLSMLCSIFYGKSK